jgi:hypothetical protein
MTAIPAIYYVHKKQHIHTFLNIQNRENDGGVFKLPRFWTKQRLQKAEKSSCPKFVQL